jgi:hypothetical protein
VSRNGWLEPWKQKRVHSCGRDMKSCFASMEKRCYLVGVGFKSFEKIFSGWEFGSRALMNVVLKRRQSAGNQRYPIRAFGREL